MYNRIGLMSYCTLFYITIGGYWVTLSWTVLGITHNQESVGKLLIIGSLCALFSAPIIGLIVDRVGYRVTTFIGQGFSFTAGLVPTVILGLGYKLTSLGLYALSLIVSVSSILCIASFDRTLKLTIEQSSLKRTRTLATVFQQIAMMFGTALTGFLISEYSELSVFPLMSFISIICILIFQFSVDRVENQVLDTDMPSKSHWFSILEGVHYIFQTRQILIASLCVAIAYASAQVINVSLPAFIRLELAQSSNLFGLCEAVWAFGGIVSAITITALLVKFKLNWLPIASLIILGFCMMCFGQFINPNIILFLCFIMGSLFTISRSLADGNLLSSCDHEMIGRVRANTMAITSLIGITIYLIPIFVNTILPSTLYLIVGLLTISLSVFLFNLSRKNKIIQILTSQSTFPQRISPR